jgi:hypothetical protein
MTPATFPSISPEESVMTTLRQDGQSNSSAAIDPITFEVIRHKLEAITEEQAITLKNASGSPVVTEATASRRRSPGPRPRSSNGWTCRQGLP